MRRGMGNDTKGRGWWGHTGTTCNDDECAPRGARPQKAVGCDAERRGGRVQARVHHRRLEGRLRQGATGCSVEEEEEEEGIRRRRKRRRKRTRWRNRMRRGRRGTQGGEGDDSRRFEGTRPNAKLLENVRDIGGVPMMVMM
eukprot:9493956-Pyramimonas_sp.AAC.1